VIFLGDFILKRVFLVVLDSFGVGELPDADIYGDCGSNTLRSVAESEFFFTPNLERLGLFNIDNININKEKSLNVIGSFGKLREVSKGKDTTIGHWEIAGIESSKPFPVYPKGFPQEVIRKLEEFTLREVVCNKACSGLDAIYEFGRYHKETGALIVYTSADSVFQIAAHEEIINKESLYNYCRIARGILVGEHNVGRVIARPFIGEFPYFKRTANRHDFSVAPTDITMLDQLKENDLQVISIGKISDIFADRSITCSERTSGNYDGIEKLINYSKKDFNGLCFVNLVDFDMLYGHRNDIDGYAKALSYFDSKIPEIIKNLKEKDILIITADHGCDPGFKKSTDHTREYIPVLIYGNRIKPGVNLGIRKTFSDIGASILDYFCIYPRIKGESFLDDIIKKTCNYFKIY